MDSTASRSSSTPGSAAVDHDIAQLIGSGGGVPSEREGLPRNYRMRADAHYVEQLESPAVPAIRLLATRQITCSELPPADRIEALTKSIAAHGILQPILVRRQAGRYTVIAGHKRLAAALAAGLTSVPCVLHEVDESAAAALAAADNLRSDVPPAAPEPDRDGTAAILRAVTSDLSTIRTSTILLKAARASELPQQVAVDLIQAQTWRAEWLIRSLQARLEHARIASVPTIIQRVAEGFAAQARLAGVQIDCVVAPNATAWKLPEEPVATVVTGAMFATLSWLEGVSHPRVEVRADAVHERSLKIEVVQRAVRVPVNVSAAVVDHDLGRSAEVDATLAFRLARALASAQGGTAELTPIPGAGSVLQITFPNNHAAA